MAVLDHKLKGVLSRPISPMSIKNAASNAMSLPASGPKGLFSALTERVGEVQRLTSWGRYVPSSFMHCNLPTLRAPCPAPPPVLLFRLHPRDEGYLAFWKGNGVNIIRIFPYSAAQVRPHCDRERGYTLTDTHIHMQTNNM